MTKLDQTMDDATLKMGDRECFVLMAALSHAVADQGDDKADGFVGDDGGGIVAASDVRAGKQEECAMCWKWRTPQELSKKRIRGEAVNLTRRTAIDRRTFDKNFPGQTPTSVTVTFDVVCIGCAEKIKEEL